MPDNIDSIYYKDGVNNSFAMSLLTIARRRMLHLFMERMRPNENTTILDIGVSDDENEGANFLEKHYPWKNRITCAGIGNGDQVRRFYPESTFVRISPNEKLPFGDRTFDIACSNAVIEHVGGPTQRRAFLSEHLRVGRSVFLTVPNRWFFVEHHTSIPFLHYVPSLFRGILAKTRLEYWTHPSHMDFVSRSTLMTDWPLETKPDFVMTGLPLGPFSSNIALIFDPRKGLKTDNLIRT